MNEAFTSEMDVEIRSLELRTALTAVAITDQASYDSAVQSRVAAKAWLKDAGEFFDGIIKPIYASYKNAMEKKKAVLEPVEQTLAGLNRGLLMWDQEQERLRRAEQRRLEELAQKEAEEQRLADAIHLEQMGTPSEVIDQVLAEPVMAMASVAAAPTYDKSKAIVYRDSWGGEVTDLKALVKYIAKNPSFINLVQVNQTAVNQLARSMKETLEIPGIRAVNNKVVASGR